jgi:hypothetical protein
VAASISFTLPKRALYRQSDHKLWIAAAAGSSNALLPWPAHSGDEVRSSSARTRSMTMTGSAAAWVPEMDGLEAYSNVRRAGIGLRIVASYVQSTSCP